MFLTATFSQGYYWIASCISFGPPQGAWQRLMVAYTWKLAIHFIKPFFFDGIWKLDPIIGIGLLRNCTKSSLWKKTTLEECLNASFKINLCCHFPDSCCLVPRNSGFFFLRQDSPLFGGYLSLGFIHLPKASISSQRLFCAVTLPRDTS